MNIGLMVRPGDQVLVTLALSLERARVAPGSRHPVRASTGVRPYRHPVRASAGVRSEGSLFVSTQVSAISRQAFVRLRVLTAHG